MGQSKQKEMLLYKEHKMWNLLTQDIVKAKIILQLKRKIDKFMKNRTQKSN